MSYILTNADLALFYGCSIRTSQERKKEINRYHKRPERAKLTAYLLSVYEGINLYDVFKIIAENRK